MWYSAKLVYFSEVGKTPDDQRLQEESIRLIRADSEAAARATAEALGERERVEYSNHLGEPVRWRFQGVHEIQDLCETELFDGVEVYSRMSWIDARNTSTSDGDPEQGISS